MIAALPTDGRGQGGGTTSPSPSRRLFLVGLGAAAVLVATGCDPRPPVALPAPGGPGGGGNGGGETEPGERGEAGSVEEAAPDPLVRSTWASRTGQAVQLQGPGGDPLPAVVDGVEDLTGGTPDDERAFRLLVRTDAPDAPDQVDRLVVGGRTHALDLFPVDRGLTSRWYQAVVCNPA